MTKDLLSETRGQKEVAHYFPILKEKNCQSRTLYPAKTFFRIADEIKATQMKKS